MAGTIYSHDWYQLLGELAKSTHKNDFPKVCAKVCKHVTDYSSLLITAFLTDEQPVHIFDEIPQKKKNQTLPPYYQGAYLLDPFYVLCCNDTPSGIYKLDEIAPDEFYESEYYKNYYADIHLTEEFAIIIRIRRDIHIVISVGFRCEKEGLESKRGKLEIIMPLLNELAVLYWHPKGIGGKKILNYDGDRPKRFGRSLTNSFRKFGTSYLTDRECEIVRFILKGHSSKAIANALNISLDTVKVHRKRCHFKLQVNSQAELFSLFLEALKLVPLDSERDPLEFYYEVHERKPEYDI